MISCKKISMLNDKFKFYNVNISEENSCLTVDEFKELCKVGTMWNFNYLTAKIWYKYNKTNSITDINNKIKNLNYMENNNDKLKILLEPIKDEFIKLNNKFITNIFTINVKNLSEYIPILIQHQYISKKILIVNRWSYTTNIDIEELKIAIEDCKNIYKLINNDSSYKAIDNILSGNEIMAIAWQCLEFGLYEESKFIFKTFVDYIEFINNKITNDTSFNYVEDGYVILSTFRRMQDIPRVDLSVKIGYAKVLVSLSNIEEAKEVYRSVFKYFSFDERSFNPNKHLFGYTGLNRIIEATIELYRIEDDVNEKKDIKKKIENMFIWLLKNKKPDNVTEGVYEPLLVIFMMIEEIYEKETNDT